jgi:hypothetical protein
MKKISFTFCLLLISFVSFAEKFVLLPPTKTNDLVTLVDHKDFVLAQNDGMITVMDIEIKLPKSITAYPVITEPNEEVLNYISQISIDSLIANIQTLQDLETRYCRHPNIFVAQNWIKEQYESWGLNVTLQDFHYFNNNNVIAVQYGTDFPDEYVVCGAHYDSYNKLGNQDDAPGADDNASGMACVLETARILSQYDFKRSIIYCAFSAEEPGLIGSKYYVKQCINQGMNIVGYFNLDMIGYLASGNISRIYLIYPSPAQPLAKYYTDVCKIYLPEMPVINLISDVASDHASFNNMGYRGVLSIEPLNISNPFIHTPDDLIGISVNNPAQVSRFTKANLASVATIAMYEQAMPPPTPNPPTNCETEPYNTTTIKIKWKKPADENTLNGYFVYRDGVKILSTPTSNLSYFDKVDDFDEHCYTVTALLGVGESEPSNESCVSISNSISEFNQKITIYPNPATEELRIEICDMRYEMSDIAIYDVSGRKQSSHYLITTSSNHQGRPPQADEVVFHISHLPAGIYFVKISDEVVGKFVKQ